MPTCQFLNFIFTFINDVLYISSFMSWKC